MLLQRDIHTSNIHAEHDDYQILDRDDEDIEVANSHVPVKELLLVNLL